MAGHAVTRAQKGWLERALAGPVVLDAEAVDRLGESEVLDGIGLSAEQAGEILQGELDMGVSSCRNPYDSPYSPAGELCAVASLRCLECRNAFVFPSNLPQPILFSKHLEQLAARLHPQVFRRTRKQSRTACAPSTGSLPPSIAVRGRLPHRRTRENLCWLE